jgi:heme-degrading monooxygenase HmoA
MATIGQLYTLGIWKTKKGRENEFIDVWQTFADWTSGNVTGSGEGTLLQDQESPQRFISFGPWDNVENIANWRKEPKFQKFVEKARQLCEEFEPQNMILVGHSSNEQD